jgi:hypothetical protein
MKNGLIIDQYGVKRYYLNDHLHRINGPAIEDPNGDKWWCFNGKTHRLDGPAIELSDGAKWWFYHGKYVSCSSQKQFEQWIRLKAFR